MKRKIVGSFEFDGGDINCESFAETINNITNNLNNSNGKIEANKRFKNVIDFECNLPMAENILDYVVSDTDFDKHLDYFGTKLKRFVIETREVE